MSKGGRYLQKKPAGAGWKKGVVIAVVAVLVLAIVLASLAILYIKGKFKLINIVTPESKDYTQEEIDNIMQYIPEDAVTYPVSDENEETEPTEETTEATEAPTEDPSAYDPGKLGKIVNIMVVGQAWRPGEEGKMSDSMILCTINKETKTLTLTSFLRDTYIKLANYRDSGGTQHTCGNQRINVAYALGYS